MHIQNCFTPSGYVRIQPVYLKKNISSHTIVKIFALIDTHRYTYLDIHIGIDSGCRLKTKLYDKRDDFNVLIVNFLFICSNVPAASACGVYISQ